MRYFGLLVAAILVLPFNVNGAEKNNKRNKYDVEVMVQNQYLGTSLTDIIDALNGTGELSLPDAVEEAIVNIQLNDTPARLRSLAESIADKKPHLVALQEVVELSCTDPSTFPPGPCSRVKLQSFGLERLFNDHLTLTLSILKELEVEYSDVAVQENISVSFPLYLDDNLSPDVILTVKDRDVILVRNDIPADDVEIVNFDDFDGFDGFDGFVCGGPGKDKDGCTYKANVMFPDPTIPQGPLVNINRGFVGVDVKIGEHWYRLVNTHLETRLDPPLPIQSFQAKALLNALAQLGSTNTKGRVRLLVAGDFNSDPEDLPFIDNDLNPIPTPYKILTEAGGLTDVWLSRPGKPQGYTCCQDSMLMNEFSEHDRRVDIVFASPTPLQVKANVLDDDPSDKIDTGFGTSIWPSDHSGVSVRLKYAD